MEHMMFRYPVARLVGDYVRSGVGLALTGLPASQLPAEGIVFWLLSGLALLFRWSRRIHVSAPCNPYCNER